MSLAESVTEQVIAMICDGRLRPGDRLPSELELMELFNVGRSSVREAIRGLALIGVVERRPRRGTILVSPLKDFPSHKVKDAIAYWALKDLFDVRALIEGHAAARAAVMATPEDIARIEKQAAAVEEKINRGRRYFKENQAFHLAIAEAAHNKVLVHLFTEVIGAMRDVRQRFETKRDIAEHRAIVNALKRRDASRARRLIEQHIHDVLDEEDAD